MIKQLCSYMYGTHVKCGDDKHLPLDTQVLGDGGIWDAADFIGKQDRKIITLEQQNTLLLGQIQELKAINNYQTFELEQKIAALEREMESNQQQYDEEYQKNIRLHERLDSLQTDNASLKQQLESSQREVSTLSGVLSSEPIMEALGVKDDNDA